MVHNQQKEAGSVLISRNSVQYGSLSILFYWKETRYMNLRDLKNR